MGWSPLIHTRFHVSRTTLDTTSSTSFILQDSHLLWFAFPDNSFSVNQQIMQSEPLNCKQLRFGLFRFRSPLLTESIFLSFPAGTKMFQFPAFPSYTLLYSCMDYQVLLPSRVSSFGYLWLYRIFAPQHSFSQLITSFFGSWCQGIHPTLLVA